MSITKRLLSLCLALLLAASVMAGCSDEQGGADAPEKVEHLSANGITTWDNGVVREDLTALEVTKLMGNGINLGNTMEAYGHITLGTEADTAVYETYWGQPVTTQEIISAMKAAGFDTLRVPVAWTNMMNYESGDYTINSAYLDRVEEIINYAINAGMYVIVNDHWDGSWWGMFGSATPATREAAMALYISMWTQIAERYKEYSDYLIFESANEELGDRLNDLNVASDSGTLDENSCYEMTNKINQTFVDTVRGTGGNNASRFLLIAGYNTDIRKTCDKRYVMPTDTVENKLLLSVHYYTPWGYCGGSVSRWGTKGDFKEQNDLFYLLKRFVNKGYGVVIGEYMVCLNEDGSVKDNSAAFHANLLDNCDLLGLCPVLWDCSTLFVRKDLTMLDKDIAELYLSRSYSAQSALTDEVIAANATAALDAAYAGAPVEFEAEAITADTSVSTAWLMYNGGDWGVEYSVGDTYKPSSKTDGIVATDVVIDGAGTYTVALDFTGTSTGYANSTAFSAIGIMWGELNYPGCVIDVKEILVNGEPYALTGKPYTTSDDKKCTRLNLYNAWVTNIDLDTARTVDGDKTDLSASIVDKDTLGSEIHTISVTFDFIPAA